MIDYIKFKNYRVFRNEQELKLRPITIVFGKNNSGKSAILKLPVLIDNMLNNNSSEVIPDISGDNPIVYTELRDIVYGKATKAVELGVAEDGTTSLNWSFFVDTMQKPNSRIEKLAMSMNGEKHSLQLDTDTIYQIDDTMETMEIGFKGLIPQNIPFTKSYATTLNKLKFSTDYIGAIRVLPQIDMRQQVTPAGKSGFSGQFAYQKLIADENISGSLLEKVSGWYEDNFAGWKLWVDKSRQPVIHIEMIKDGLKTNITETGMGIMQSLPIVVRACEPCDSPTLIIIEEPETHLHSAAHASLGELIALSTKTDSNKRYLIETHSKNLILRLRRLIANKQLSVDDVALYYVEFNEQTNSSSLRKINIQDDGSVDYWPKQMFDESLQEAIAIRTIQIRNSHDSRN